MIVNDFLGCCRCGNHPSTPEKNDYAKIAADLGGPHLIVDASEIELADFLANTPQRCYIMEQP